MPFPPTTFFRYSFGRTYQTLIHWRRWTSRGFFTCFHTRFSVIPTNFVRFSYVDFRLPITPFAGKIQELLIIPSRGRTNFFNALKRTFNRVPLKLLSGTFNKCFLDATTISSYFYILCSVLIYKSVFGCTIIISSYFYILQKNLFYKKILLFFYIISNFSKNCITNKKLCKKNYHQSAPGDM